MSSWVKVIICVLSVSGILYFLFHLQPSSTCPPVIREEITCTTPATKEVIPRVEVSINPFAPTVAVKECIYSYPGNQNMTQFFKLLGRLPSVDANSFLIAWLKPEAARYGAAPQKIPPVLQSRYSLDGKVPVTDYYFDEAYLGGTARQSIWTVSMINELREKTKRRVNVFNYDNSCLFSALDAHQGLITGGSGLVVGSETPWAEAMLLEYGAKSIVTLEFGSIESQHPAIRTYTPLNFTASFLGGKLPQFDFAFTYSSIEHDGLGRYGDILNPDGDIQTMTRLLQLVKPGGTLFLGVPCCDKDHLYWNAHREYGPLRLPLLMAGWHPLGIYYSKYRLGLAVAPAEHIEQPVLVLQNTVGCSNSPNQLS